MLLRHGCIWPQFVRFGASPRLIDEHTLKAHSYFIHKRWQMWLVSEVQPFHSCISCCIGWSNLEQARIRDERENHMIDQLGKWKWEWLIAPCGWATVNSHAQQSQIQGLWNRHIYSHQISTVEGTVFGLRMNEFRRYNCQSCRWHAISAPRPRTFQCINKRTEWGDRARWTKIASGTKTNDEKEPKQRLNGRCQRKETAMNINDLIVHNQKDSENTE